MLKPNSLISELRRNFPTVKSNPLVQFISLDSINSAALRQTPPNLQHQLHIFEEEEDESIDVGNTPYWSERIHALCSAPGGADEALRLLDRLRLRGFRPVLLNIKSIIHALCAAGRYDEAHRRFLFWLAANRGDHDERTSNVLIARLLDSKTPHRTLDLVKFIWNRVSPGFVLSLTNFNRLLHQLCLGSEPHYAHGLLIERVANAYCPNVVSYTTLMSGYLRVGRVGDALKVFDELSERSLVPNSMTLSILIRVVLRNKDIDRAKRLIKELWEKMRSSEPSSLKVNNAAFANLIDALCEAGLHHQVFSIAETMPPGKSVSDEFACNQIINSLCVAGKFHGASRIFYIMQNRNLNPSLVSYNAVIHGLSEEGGCLRAYQLFEKGINFSYVPSEFTYRVLVGSLCNEGDIAKAKDVFQFMLRQRGVDKTRMFNIYLRAIRNAGNASELINVLDLMTSMNEQPDVITLNTILDGLGKSGWIEEAVQILNNMIWGKFCSPDVVSFTSVINGLLHSGNVEKALSLLNKDMAERGIEASVVTYDTIIRGLFKLKKPIEAKETYKKMISKGVAASSSTYTAILNGLFESGEVDEAKRFWDDVVWPSKVYDDFVYASVLKGLCGAGKLSEACDFLYELVDCGLSPSAVCYNILISTACKSGLKKQAYQILGEMKKNGMSPDAITWRILEKLHGDISNQFCDETSTVLSHC